jgi:hypothetical protein
MTPGRDKPKAMKVLGFCRNRRLLGRQEMTGTSGLAIYLALFYWRFV